MAEFTVLVRQAQRGNALAMDELIRHLTPYVARLCGPIAMQDAADAAQESFIAILRNLHHLNEPAAIFAWVRAICAREAARVAKRSRRTIAAELTEVPVRGDPQVRTDIADVLSRLTPEHRAVLVLRVIEGLDERSVAQILNLPLGTVRSRLFRARLAFHRAWFDDNATVLRPKWLEGYGSCRS
jgi:RNA polymerase sigma-70 factor (ECF subfamily)